MLLTLGLLIIAAEIYRRHQSQTDLVIVCENPLAEIYINQQRVQTMGPMTDGFYLVRVPRGEKLLLQDGEGESFYLHCYARSFFYWPSPQRAQILIFEPSFPSPPQRKQIQ